MKPYHRSLIALPTLLLMPHMVVAESSAPPDPARPGFGSPGMPPGLRPALGDWAVRMTFIVPVDPDEPRPRPRVPSDADRPVIRERDAVLPDPLNGWALVDRVVAHMAPGRPIPVPSIHFPRPHRVHQHWRLGPNHVLPVAAGG